MEKRLKTTLFKILRDSASQTFPGTTSTYGENAGQAVLICLLGLAINIASQDLIGTVSINSLPWLMMWSIHATSTMVAIVSMLYFLFFLVVVTLSSIERIIQPKK